MKIINKPFPHISIDNFIPSEAIVRAAAESFELMDDNNWVKYGGDGDGQVQYCSKLGRHNVPSAALLVLDYISTHFDPNKVFGITDNVFPDTSHFGGGMMLTPNLDGEGAEVHGKNQNWKREYSAVLGISEEYDSSFDLLLHDGDVHTRVPYKFNRLNVFKCSENSWHGLPEITKGMNRKTLGVMYWSVMTEDDKKTARVRAKFNNDLEF